MFNLEVWFHYLCLQCLLMASTVWLCQARDSRAWVVSPRSMKRRDLIHHIDLFIQRINSDTPSKKNLPWMIRMSSSDSSVLLWHRQVGNKSCAAEINQDKFQRMPSYINTLTRIHISEQVVELFFSPPPVYILLSKQLCLCVHDVDEEDKRVGVARACRPLTSELQRFFKVMTGAQSDRQTDRQRSGFADPSPTPKPTAS